MTTVRKHKRTIKTGKKFKVGDFISYKNKIGKIENISGDGEIVDIVWNAPSNATCITGDSLPVEVIKKYDTAIVKKHKRTIFKDFKITDKDIKNRINRLSKIVLNTTLPREERENARKEINFIIREQSKKKKIFKDQTKKYIKVV